MSQTITSTNRQDKITMFLWQHLLLIFSLFIMTLGVALCVRSNFGSSVISTIPYVMTIAGADAMAPNLTIGEYTYCMNFVLVFLQIIILRKKFELVQLFQLVIGFIFGFLLDVNMAITAPIICNTIISKTAIQLLGCVVLASGISMEIRCGSVTMPGEGFPVALSRVTGIPFPKAKIIVDISLVAIAVALGFIFFGKWIWSVVGPGTLIAMVLVGAIVRFLNPYMKWFDRALYFRPGFTRHVYGLARFIYRRFK